MAYVKLFPGFSLGAFLSALWRQGLEQEFGDLNPLYRESNPDGPACLPTGRHAGQYEG